MVPTPAHAGPFMVETPHAARGRRRQGKAESGYAHGFTPRHATGFSSRGRFGERRNQLLPLMGRFPGNGRVIDPALWATSRSKITIKKAGYKTRARLAVA